MCKFAFVMTLDKLALGKTAEIIAVGGEGSLRQHFLDMGMIPGQKVTLLKFAPLGDPMQILINDYTLSLRKSEAAFIRVEACEPDPKPDYRNMDDGHGTHSANQAVHPGLG